MAKATLINQAGNKVVVDSGSPQASQYFGQGYKLMGATNTAIPTGATKIAGPSGLQGLNESQLFRQGQDIYKLPSVTKTLTSDQVTGSIPDVQATNQAENYLPNYVAGQNKYMEMVMGDLGSAQEDIKKQEELATTTNAKLGNLYEQAGLKGTEYTSELEKYNYGANVSQLQEINKQIASKNAEFEQAINAQEGRAGLAGSIYGRQSLIQRQQASQIGALSSMAQALQGNITLAQQTAKDALDIKYSSIENEIEQTKSQIESIYEQLDRSDKKKADAQLLALNERTRVLEEQKASDEQVNQVMLSAAQNGATVDTLNKIMNSKTLGDAIINSGNYLQTPTKTDYLTLTDPLSGEEYYIDPVTKETIRGGSSDVENGILVDGSGQAYDIKSYATDPNHEVKIQSILTKIGKFNDVTDIDSYIQTNYTNSPVTGQMIANSASKYGVSWEMMVAIMAQDSSMGTAGKAVRTKNPGNVGNTDDGSTRTFGSWQEGVDAVAKNLAWRKTDAPKKATENITEDGYDVSRFNQGFYNTTLGQKVLNNEQQYYTNFLSQPAVKTFIENQTKAGSIQAIVDSGVGGPEDLALVFEFMKALDPTSVVRESEYDTASKAGNPFKQVAAKMGGYVSKGQILPEEVKQSFIKLANIKLEEQRKIYDVIRSEARKTAYQQGLNPEHVAPSLLTNDIQSTASPESQWLQELGLSDTQPSQITPETEQTKSSAWNWFRGLFGAKPQQSMKEKVGL